MGNQKSDQEVDLGDASTHEASISQRTAPSRVFQRAMSAVKERCEQMAHQLRDGDSVDFAHAAQSATDLWFAGRSACRRILVDVKEASPYSHVARSFLETHCMVLLKLFAQATETMPSARLKEVLSILHQRLTGAMSEPLAADSGLPVSDQYCSPAVGQDSGGHHES